MAMSGPDAWRRLANLANLSTPLGVAVARLGGAVCRRGAAGFILAEGYRFGFPAAAAFTVGDVLITGQRWDELLRVHPRLMAHEQRHSRQYAIFGWAFLPLYGAALAWSWLRARDRWSHNVFERWAGLADGGYLS